MGGYTGKRSKPAKPCARCGLKIVGDFMRNKKGDFHKDCWDADYKEREAQEKKSDVP